MPAESHVRVAIGAWEFQRPEHLHLLCPIFNGSVVVPANIDSFHGHQLRKGQWRVSDTFWVIGT